MAGHLLNVRRTGFSDPVFRARVERETGKTVEDDILAASSLWIGDVFSGASHSWEEIAHLRAHWDGPLVLKPGVAVLCAAALDVAVGAVGDHAAEEDGVEPPERPAKASTPRWRSAAIGAARP